MYLACQGSDCRFTIAQGCKFPERHCDEYLHEFCEVPKANRFCIYKYNDTDSHASFVSAYCELESPFAPSLAPPQPLLPSSPSDFALENQTST
mmetsp:Transcript_54288/g.140180  ORF Transcript_54288/g.140180 Transcript_54288/m.140180 type:complete len:93 (-) Transcript_54288:473-751(-)